MEKIKNNKIKPILFSTPMVQAILRGKKTQTRRIINPQPTTELFSAIIGGYDNVPKMARFWTKREPNNPLIEDVELKYKVGDILWVRETWHPKRHSFPIGEPFEYKATAKEDGNPTDEPWKPSIFMPKEACRIFLKLTDIRVERLNDISVSDAISEGIEKFSNGSGFRKYHKKDKVHLVAVNPIESYQSLWEKINGEKSWSENPFVWVYKFEQINDFKL
jgi:hypothetical protein